MEFGTIRLVQRRARLLIASSSFLVNWAMNSTASARHRRLFLDGALLEEQ
jgi:hypothetical protein